MIRRILSLCAFAAVIAGATASGAQAQAARTWVSGVGDDVNPCSRFAPCKTFAGAISKTEAGGQISVLDPGGYGTVTITKAISIVADGDYGSILASATTGITISPAIPAGARVHIRGIDIDGAGTTIGTNGVRVLGAAKVILEDVHMRNFSNAGVSVEGPAGARVFLDRVTITATNNGVSLPGANANSVIITDSVIDGSAVAAVNIGAAGTAVIGGSTLSGSGGASDLLVAAGGQAISYGDNLIRSGNPTSTTPLK